MPRACDLSDSHFQNTKNQVPTPRAPIAHLSRDVLIFHENIGATLDAPTVGTARLSVGRESLAHKPHFSGYFLRNSVRATEGGREGFVAREANKSDRHSDERVRLDGFVDMEGGTVLVRLGSEWWAEPMERPADRDTIATYDVDPQVLARWRKARNDYLAARAALVGQIERQGWRAPATQPSTGYVDIVFTGPPSEPGQFVEIEDDQGNSIRLGEWIERNDGYWVLRVRR